ncbi:hypothetical protein V8E53_007767 [Lactarius tabidus]
MDLLWLVFQSDRHTHSIPSSFGLSTMPADALQSLEITAITLASLSGLFGVYLVLFVLAVWSTYLRPRRIPSSKRLRWVTILLFVVLLAHFITRCLEFSRARLQIDTDRELLRWSIPLTFLGNITTTFAALFSDGTLAWRFYIIFERKRWALYLPATAVVANALLCWAADFQHLAIYVNREYYENTLLPITLNITVAWGWFIFVNNTLMTGGILYKIMLDNFCIYVRTPNFYYSRWPSYAVRSLRHEGVLVLVCSRRYDNALRAVIEPALVTWIGILIYEITSLAPKGHITTDLDVGYIMMQILPIFFGISQCLITARVGLLRETRSPGTDYQLSRARGPVNCTYDPSADTSTTVSEVEVSGAKTVTEEFV